MKIIKQADMKLFKDFKVGDIVTRDGERYYLICQMCNNSQIKFGVLLGDLSNNDGCTDVGFIYGFEGCTDLFTEADAHLEIK